MARNTKISWCDDTFNPWRGCTKVSPGCANCYAEAMDKRFGGDRWGVGKARERTSAKYWADPLKWNAEASRHYGICTVCGDPVYMNNPMSVECGCGIYGSAITVRRRRVFCASLADWLDPEVPVEWLANLLALISATPHLDWLLLTKRVELWRPRLQAVVALTPSKIGSDEWRGCSIAEAWLAGHRPLPNVWVGTTVEDQQRADLRIPALLNIPAQVRFLSCEPLLEAVDLHSAGMKLDGRLHVESGERRFIHWVICGGESGSKARPFNLAWARSLRDQCAAAGVPFFMKQVGANPIEKGRVLRDSARRDSHDFIWDRAGADPAEWPADLLVQQFPTVRGAA